VRCIDELPSVSHLQADSAGFMLPHIFDLHKNDAKQWPWRPQEGQLEWVCRAIIHVELGSCSLPGLEALLALPCEEV
jgi:hypothetical protein